MGEGWTGGASDIVKAMSSGEDPRATGGLVSNLPHPRVNKTKQHTHRTLEDDRSGRTSYLGDPFVDTCSLAARPWGSLGTVTVTIPRLISIEWNKATQQRIGCAPSHSVQQLILLFTTKERKKEKNEKKERNNRCLEINRFRPNEMCPSSIVCA